MSKQPKQFFGSPEDKAEVEDEEGMLCKTVVTRDRRYITQITCYEKGQEQGLKKSSARPPTYGKQSGGSALASLFNFRGNQAEEVQANPALLGESMARTRNRLKQQILTGTATTTSSTTTATTTSPQNTNTFLRKHLSFLICMHSVRKSPAILSRELQSKNGHIFFWVNSHNVARKLHS